MAPVPTYHAVSEEASFGYHGTLFPVTREEAGLLTTCYRQAKAEAVTLHYRYQEGEEHPRTLTHLEVTSVMRTEVERVTALFNLVLALKRGELPLEEVALP